MTPTTPCARQTQAATSLRDFTIQGAVEVGACHGAQSFRALRRRDGRPVLLHKFRPAEPLIALGPLRGATEPPDFSRPFVTRFSDLFAVAGSAYLVEPLPPCTALGEVWRHVLQKRPQQAVTVMAVLIRQMIAIARDLVAEGHCHGAFDLDTLVLSPAGCFGALTARLECAGGARWLRGNPDAPRRPDSYRLVEVLGALLDLDAEVAVLQGAPMRVPMGIHRRIRDLLHAIERAQPYPCRSLRS